MLPKFVAIPSAAIPIAILGSIGYVPNAVQTPPGARVGLDSAGRVEWTALRDSVRSAPAFPAACDASLRTAVTPTARYAAWWAVRPDSSAGSSLRRSRLPQNSPCLMAF